MTSFNISLHNQDLYILAVEWTRKAALCGPSGLRIGARVKGTQGMAKVAGIVAKSRSYYPETPKFLTILNP